MISSTLNTLDWLWGRQSSLGMGRRKAGDCGLVGGPAEGREGVDGGVLGGRPGAGLALAEVLAQRHQGDRHLHGEWRLSLC